MEKRKTYKDFIGDGQLPNKYWVSLSNDYLYQHTNEDRSVSLDWIGDILKGFVSKGKTIARPFKTYAGAKAFCDKLVLGDENGYDFIVNRINIEDRLSGELLERTRVFDPSDCTASDFGSEDTTFTRNEMAKRGVMFK